MTHGGIDIDLFLKMFVFYKVLMHEPDVGDNLNSAVHVASVPKILQPCRAPYYLTLVQIISWCFFCGFGWPLVGVVEIFYVDECATSNSGFLKGGYEFGAKHDLLVDMKTSFLGIETKHLRCVRHNVNESLFS